MVFSVFEGLGIDSCIYIFLYKLELLDLIVLAEPQVEVYTSLISLKKACISFVPWHVGSWKPPFWKTTADLQRPHHVHVVTMFLDGS